MLFSVEGRANGSPTGRVYVSEPVVFDAIVTGKHCDPQDLSYVWNFGDGTSSQAAKPTHTYGKPGTYRVEVQVKCGNCDTRSDVLGVVVSCPEVRITGSKPDIEELCPGCSMQFFAETVPADLPVRWLIVPGSDLDSKATISSTGLLTIAADASKGDVVVRATVSADDSDCFDEKSVFVFIPANIPKDENGRTKAEIEWSRQRPFCAGYLKLGLMSDCFGARDEVFGRECVTPSNAANAFLHAYCSCVVARLCGVEASKGLWDAHEEYDKNSCQDASMDFHNNEVGRDVSLTGEGSCREEVLQALRAGRLRWIQDPEQKCPTYVDFIDPTDACQPRED